MGKIKNHIHEWLETYGYKLGYDMTNAPELSDFWWVAENEVDSETYWNDKYKEKD